jgi:PPK2 family polyphosphate:nucleotide phosphotransferase
MAQALTPKAGSKFKLADFDPGFKGDDDKDAAAVELAENVVKCDELAYKLYAENRRAILIVLQGMDAAGKDGTIRHVLTGIDPQSFQITSFKQPSIEELDHGFLWRIHKAVPRKGNIGVFNRSHYEDVVVVRVLNLIDQAECDRRYGYINEFERMLCEANVTILKFFLHISKEEQLERLKARLDDPKKRWKFSPSDTEMRKTWDAHQQAYENALVHCNTEHAPWYIVPSDRKWRRNLIVSRVLREALEKLDPKYPEEHPDLDKIVLE